jgi:hypothetical protein
VQLEGEGHRRKGGARDGDDEDRGTAEVQITAPRLQRIRHLAEYKRPAHVDYDIVEPDLATPAADAFPKEDGNLVSRVDRRLLEAG